MQRFFGLLGLMLAVAMIAAGCGGTSGQEGGVGAEDGEPEPTLGTDTAAPVDEGDGGGTASARGKEVFTQSCAGCHTLADANANGTVGPDLDDLQPDKEQVISAIEEGPGSMPENIVQGDDAEAVAEYVSAVAGQ